MAVLKSNNKQRHILSSLMFSFFIGTIIFAGYLINLSSKLSNSIGTLDAKFGPLNLFEIYKNASKSGGFNAGFKFQSGIIMYILIMLIVGMIISIIRINNGHKFKEY